MENPLLLEMIDNVLPAIPGLTELARLDKRRSTFKPQRCLMRINNDQLVRKASPVFHIQQLRCLRVEQEQWKFLSLRRQRKLILDGLLTKNLSLYITKF